MKKAKALTIAMITLALTALATTLTVHASDSSVSVTVLDCGSQTYGNKGLCSGGYWVGEIPLNITSCSVHSLSMGYCINFDRVIYIGSTYSASIVSANDSAEWRAVSYLLTWNFPKNNSEAAAAQVAVWRLLNQTRGVNYYRESWLDQSIDNAGNALASQAYGKDVFRQGDQFTWISPVSGNGSATQASPGQTVTFTARLTTSTCTPRANVRVLFNATLNSCGQSQLLNSTYVAPTEAFTDSQGMAQVSVTVPATAPLGSSVTVDAATKSVWPQRYIDVTDPSTQDLLGVGNAFELTISSSVCITATLQVLPESQIGSVTAFTAFAAGFAVWIKVKRSKIQVVR
jgi:hypothetical protein